MRLTDEQIGAELRALRPTPSERFAADLDQRAASGFRTEGQADWGLLTRLRRRLAAVPARRLVPAAGAAATLIVVAGVAISQTALDRGDQQAPRSLEAEPQGAPPAPSGAAERGREAQPLDEPASPTSPVAPGLTVPPTPPDGELKPGRDRVEERSASLTLSADPDEVAEIADRVVEVTERYDGFVLSSEVSSGDQDEARASFDLRIPTANLRAALADLSDLGHVSSRNEGSLDITAPFVTAEERFGDARAEVDALLEQLGEAGSADEIAAIRDRLRLAREELAAAREQLGALKQRRDYSVLSVSITAVGDGPGWSLGEAADDALSVLESIGGALLVALAVIVPLGALLALIWLGARRLTERRRDRALDRS